MSMDELTGTPGHDNEADALQRMKKHDKLELDIHGPQLSDNGIRFVDISTCHITSKDDDLLIDLAQQYDGAFPSLSVFRTDCGYFVSLHHDGNPKEFAKTLASNACRPPYTFSDEFLALANLAVHQGFFYLHFDRDAKEYEGLPRFEW